SHNDTDRATSTPSDPYDLALEYGRAPFDPRHSFNLVGNFTLPLWELRLTPNVSLRSGNPFNITTGRDNNGDNAFIDRPAFAKPGDPGAIVTRFGTFNPNPGPGDLIIPRNFGQGPGSISVNVGISKTIGFGPPPNNFPGMSSNRGGQQNGQQNRQGQNQRGGAGGARGGNAGGGNTGGGGARGGQAGAPAGGMQVIGGGGGGDRMVMMGGPGGFGGGSRHKYNLTIAINAMNVLNHLNEGNFNGTLTSPFFGRSNNASGGGGGGGFGFSAARRIDLSLRFNF